MDWSIWFPDAKTINIDWSYTRAISEKTCAILSASKHPTGAATKLPQSELGSDQPGEHARLPGDPSRRDARDFMPAEEFRARPMWERTVYILFRKDTYARQRIATWRSPSHPSGKSFLKAFEWTSSTGLATPLRERRAVPRSSLRSSKIGCSTGGRCSSKNLLLQVQSGTSLSHAVIRARPSPNGEYGLSKISSGWLSAPPTSSTTTVIRCLTVPSRGSSKPSRSHAFRSPMSSVSSRQLIQLCLGWASDL